MIQCDRVIMSYEEIEAIRRKATFIGVDDREMVSKVFNDRMSCIISELLPDEYIYKGYDNTKDIHCFYRNSTIIVDGETWDTVEEVEVWYGLRNRVLNVLDIIGNLTARATNGVVDVKLSLESSSRQIYANYNYTFGYGDVTVSSTQRNGTVLGSTTRKIDECTTFFVPDMIRWYTNNEYVVTSGGARIIHKWLTNKGVMITYR